MENTLTFGQVMDNLEVGQVAIKVKGLQGISEISGEELCVGMYIDGKGGYFRSLENNYRLILSYNPEARRDRWIILDRDKYDYLVNNA